MKISHILPILILPVIANAEENSFKIRPFVEYRTGVYNYTKTKIQQNKIDISESHETNFNYDNQGDFVFGLDFNNILSLSVTPCVSRKKTIMNPKSEDEQITVELTNEIDVELDIFLSSNTKFKPFLSLDVAYLGTDEPDFYLSNFGFGAGLGFRQYINENVYFGAGITWFVTPKMYIERIEGIENFKMQMSGVNWQFSIGYKF